MINKIKNSGSIDVGEAARKRSEASGTQGNTNKPGDAKTQEQAGVNTRTDSVQLTGGADKIRAKSVQLASEDKVDPARVARIQQALENGTYQIDSKKIAAKMVAFEDALNK